VPTNVISITDGQILLKPELFYSGIRPAMDVGASVSRVAAAKTRALRAVSNTLKGDMSRYHEVQAFAQFGASDLDAATRNLLNQGEKLTEILKQDQFNPMSLGEQVVSLSVGVQVDELPTVDVRRFEGEVLAYMRDQHQDVLDDITQTEALSDEAKVRIDEAIEKVKSGFQASA
jgi:F-type H+-transporting ATPase subunit alpha